MSSAREEILQKVREGLGVKAGRPIPPPPPVRLVIPELSAEDRIASFRTRLEALNGRVHIVASQQEADAKVEEIRHGRSFVTSRQRPSKAECAAAEVGITSAAYALAATGTLVVLANEQEQRLVSLLPPAHIAVIHASCILTNLDELFTRIPKPADMTSALIFITGPSRTGDIEQILIRGVHGPGEVDVVIIT